MSVEIPLTQGYVAIVDDEDGDAVLAHKWNAKPHRRTVYARRQVRRPDGSVGVMTLHKFLTGFAITDHRNGNGLDNRRANLREATVTQNNQNASRQVNCRSGFKGVTWHAKTSKWRAAIRVSGKKTHLGMYLTAEEAGLAYDEAAREHHGEFATLNFPRPGERSAWT